jgi:hypothetical protein
MRRSASTARTNSTQTGNSRIYFDAERSIRELQERVSKLERLMAEHFGQGTEELSEVFTAAERRKPGPKPRHSGMIFLKRDELVQMLERYWPEIEFHCFPKPNPLALRAVLHAIESQEQNLPPGESRHLWAVKHLLDSWPQLCNFLSGNRFRRDPRQIANAFAGVPQVSVWRSLKLCQAQPSNHSLGQRALRAYIRRKHPELYGNLLAEESLINFANSLKRYRSKDRQVTGLTAQYLHYCWEKCTPDRQLLATLNSK